MSKKRKNLIVLACSGGALAMSQPALAQRQQNTSTAPANNVPAATAADDTSLTDIVVTAQRRSENLRDVPIAITVVSGETLKRQSFTQLSDIQYLAPSVQYAPTPAAAVFQIRGIGTQTFDFAIEQSVGVSLDDVVQTLPRVNPLNSLADVERVEVLRGPQGTLLGKNTSAGLISITTKRPQLGVYSDEGHLQYGENHALQAYDIVNLPVSDTIALRLRAGYQLSDNVYRNVGPGSIANNRDYNFNGKVLWEPNERLTVYAIGDYQGSRGDPGEWSVRKVGIGNISTFGLTPIVGPALAKLGITAGADNRTVALSADNYQHSTSYGGQLSVSYDLGGPTVTSVTAYREVKFDNTLEADQTPLPILDNNSGRLHAHEVTQELRLASPSRGMLQYVVGLYYYDQKTKDTSDQSGSLGLPLTLGVPVKDPLTRFSTLGGQSNFSVETKSYAVFGEATLRATRKLRLIVGGRWTQDDNQSSFFLSALPHVCQPTTLYYTRGTCLVTSLPSAVVGGRRKHGDWSGRAGIQYDLADRTMGYATVSRGYKGAAVTTVSGLVFDIEPETVVSYEAGIKSEILDRRLSINVALFHSKFSNFQTQVFDPTLIGGLGAFHPGNAGGLRTQGVEVEFTGRPARGLTISGGATFDAANFTSFTDASCPITFNCPASKPTFDASGDRLPNAPRWTYTLGANYQILLTQGLKGYATANWAYRSAVVFGVGDEDTRQAGYGLANVSVGIGDPDDHVRVSMYVRNLFDKRFAGVIFPSFFDARGYSQVLPDAAFRRIGAALDWHF